MPDDGAHVLIELRGLTKLYTPVPGWMRLLARTGVRTPVLALDGVDLTVRAGEICAVVGPNGAGKTTLFRILVGLTTPSGGAATVLGFDVEHESEQVRQVLGWMPADDRSLLMRATSRENLHLHGRLQGMTRRHLNTRIDEVLELVGIADKRDSMVATLSSGMKARLQLARAILPSPRVLLLDEPTGAIDPVAAHSLLGLITDLVREQQLAVLISSHRLEEIEALHSYALLLDRGRVRYTGDLDKLRDEWERPRVRLEFPHVSTATRAAVDLVAAGIETAVEGADVVCRLPAKTGVGALLVELGPLTAELHRVREAPMPLRDLIARMYARQPTATGGGR